MEDDEDGAYFRQPVHFFLVMCCSAVDKWVANLTPESAIRSNRGAVFLGARDSTNLFADTVTYGIIRSDESNRSTANNNGDYENKANLM